MATQYLDKTGLAYFWSKLKDLLAGKQDKLSDATDSTAGLVKTNSSESITLNSNGQLDVGGR